MIGQEVSGEFGQEFQVGHLVVSKRSWKDLPL